MKNRDFWIVSILILLICGLLLTAHGDSATVTEGMCPQGQAVNGMSNTLLQCTGMPATVLRGTSNPLGGQLLLLGGCSTATGSLPGVTVNTSLNASPATTTTIAAGLSSPDVWMSATDTVTIRRCALLTITPAAVNYNIAGNP